MPVCTRYHNNLFIDRTTNSVLGPHAAKSKATSSVLFMTSLPLSVCSLRYLLRYETVCYEHDQNVYSLFSVLPLSRSLLRISISYREKMHSAIVYRYRDLSFTTSRSSSKHG